MPSVTASSAPVAKVKANFGKYLTFSLGNESYAIHVLKVREIIRLPDITPIPQMPDYVKGVINLRGKVIPVIDLRVRFRFPTAEFNERTCLVVVCIRLPSGANGFMGLIVDVVEEVLNVNANDIEPTPDFGSKLDTNYIMGIAKVKAAVKTILDIDKIVVTDMLQSVTEQSETQKSPATT